jgi:hypothetical protein
VVHQLPAHPGDWREGAGGLLRCFMGKPVHDVSEGESVELVYTATATIWRKLEGNDEYGDPLGYAEPEQILCDYEGGLSKS